MVRVCTSQIDLFKQSDDLLEACGFYELFQVKVENRIEQLVLACMNWFLHGLKNLF